jgi:putative chitinase
MLTQEKLEKILGHTKEIAEWFAALETVLPEFGIDTKERIAGFLAQCAHESADFTLIKENLNYSAEGLNKIFKKYFPTIDDAAPYARKPEMIANKVYGNRMGNGDESSGDGFKYRGRGLIQLTGKDNYRACSTGIFGDEQLLDNPDFLLTKEGAVRSACWFWKKNNLNKWADAGDFDGLSDVINRGRKTEAHGDAIGFAHRNEKYQLAISIL